MIDNDDEIEAVGVMRIGRENRSNGRKHVPVPLCFVHHKPHMNWPGLEPGQPLWEADN
jgi:hypothetical protein